MSLNRRDAKRRSFWVCCLVLWLFFSQEAAASSLLEEFAEFPNWVRMPTVGVARGDLIYPDWLEGTWRVRSTLVDMAAPLAPDVVSPGFEGNRQRLGQPVEFQVRFVRAPSSLPTWRLIPRPVTQPLAVVADREFNGLSLARAYLGNQAVLEVKVAPDSPNRQVTRLRGDRQLVSVVTGRGTKTPSDDHFVATEVSQQLFRGGKQPYFNQVETTTAYEKSSIAAAIIAIQVTAVYLSPQDPDFFRAGSRPVALYRYRLELFRSGTINLLKSAQSW